MIRLTVAFLFSAVLVSSACSKQTKGSKTALCKTMACIQKYNGKIVRLEGTLKVSDAGKTKITTLTLPDGTGVVFSYGVSPSATEFAGIVVHVRGRVYEGPPPTKYPVQQLLAPHIIETGIVKGK